MAEMACVTAFRSLINSYLEEFVAASTAIGEPLTTMAMHVRTAFQLELNFITEGVNFPRPNENTLNKMTLPLCAIIHDIQEFRNQSRSVKQFFDHLSAVSESIVALSWITVTPAPAQFVRDMRDAGEYFGNRVLSANRGNLAHTDWMKKYYDLLKALESYVKTYHLTGFTWDATRVTAAAAVFLPPLDQRPAPPAAGQGPPPPPHQRFPRSLGTMPDAGTGGDDRQALFSQINQGDAIVQMLKPVQQRYVPFCKTGIVTVLSEAGPVDQSAPAPTASAPTAPAPTAPAPSASTPSVRTYPPKFILDGKKWRVEHQKDSLGMVINNDEMSESLAMFKCENSCVEVKNKMNGVTIDNCKRSSVVLNDIISSVEAIRCERLQIQCNGHVPLISIDNCDSVQIFIGEKSLDVEIISSKSTSCNVCIMASNGDYVELPMPEQIRTVVANRALRSSVVEKI